MEIMGIPEKDLRANKPIHIWMAQDEKGGPRMVFVKIASITDCDEWLEEAAKVEAIDKEMTALLSTGDIDGAREKRKEFSAALLDATKKYPGLTEADFKGVNWSQVMGGFWLLKTLSDPFDYSQAKTDATTREKLEMYPSGLLEKAISNMPKPAALSGSANGTT